MASLNKSGLEYLLSKIYGVFQNVNTEIKNIKDDTVKRMIEVTYSELKELRDSSKLVPGQQYRITDYVTTTSQEYTKSAGHQFDIIVTADSENTLNEIARVCLHDGDTYFSESGANLEAWQIWYCIDNDIERFVWADVENGKGVIYRMIDAWGNDLPYDFKNIQFKRYILNQDDAVATNIAKDGDLELVKDKLQNMCYQIHTCLWYYGSYITDVYPEAELEAKYVPFGDIRYSNNGPSVLCKIGENFEYFYTFHNDGDASLLKPNIEENVGVWDNVIKNSNFTMSVTEEGRVENGYNNQYLNDIVFYGKSCHFNTFGNHCFSNTFGDDCNFNTFGNLCSSNTFCNYCYSNTFGNYFFSNTFGDDCYFNTFGNQCISNTFGTLCESNTFGTACYSNTFGNSCFSNTFGNSCYSNTFGNSCYSNTFGNYCYENTIKDTYDNRLECYNNVFGDSCYKNEFDSGCCSNTLGNECHENNFYIGCKYNILGINCYGNDFSDGCIKNTLGDYTNNIILQTECESNIFEKCYEIMLDEGCIGNHFGINANNFELFDHCNYNKLGDNCSRIFLETGCEYNTFGNGCSEILLGDYCKYNTFGNGCINIGFVYYNAANINYLNNIRLGNFVKDSHFGLDTIHIDETDDISNLRNINVAQGFFGDVDIDSYGDYFNKDYEISIGKNSNDEIKIFCIADLLN